MESPELHGCSKCGEGLLRLQVWGSPVHSGVRDPHATGALTGQPDSTLPAVLVSGASGQHFGVPSGLLSRANRWASRVGGGSTRECWGAIIRPTPSISIVIAVSGGNHASAAEPP